MTKKDFDKKLKSINLTRQEFADITKLAYSSVSNWHDKKSLFLVRLNLGFKTILSQNHMKK